MRNLVIPGALLLFTSATALAGDVPDVKASCDERKTEFFADTCIGFTEKLVKKGEKFLKANCSDKGSVLLNTACPKELAVGQCVQDAGASVWTYYSGGKKKYTPTTAKAACEEAKGTWVPAK